MFKKKLQRSQIITAVSNILIGRQKGLKLNIYLLPVIINGQEISGIDPGR